MYPHGIIYQSGRSGSHSEFTLRPKLLVRIIYHLFRTAGFGFLAFAITGFLFTFYPILKEEFNYLTQPKEQVGGFGELISEALAEKTDEIKKETSTLGINSYFSLNIPKIDAKANIVPNVGAGNFAEYSQALKEGIAHAKGTNFPGQGRAIYLFSHSTDSPLNFNRYNAVFYLLGRLNEGDKILVYFLDHKYAYRVDEKVVVPANDISWLNDKGLGERLILQTCDPPGTSLRRLLIIAVPLDR